MFNDEAFIENLLIRANPDIEDSALDLMIEDVKPVLYDRVMTHVLSKMTEEQIGTFTNLTKKTGNDKEIEDFLTTTIPNYDDFMEQTYTDFEKMYLEEFKTAYDSKEE